ncbi:hypothetical protein PYW08_000433 [Mythimna loreyi]|uniref:Uncharacterized protein n=1 Tax=Mythimna loreyi TaxID=667449 RepID=A0ACC2RCG1_9NEOP|nr:hypothetical protein PYW08_000433 [Mythimna loreyi]
MKVMQMPCTIAHNVDINHRNQAAIRHLCLLHDGARGVDHEPTILDVSLVLSLSRVGPHYTILSSAYLYRSMSVCLNANSFKLSKDFDAIVTKRKTTERGRFMYTICTRTKPE